MSPVPILSSQETRSETGTPTAALLPSWELLQLQWDLQRVARASASAGFLATLFRHEGPSNAGMSTIVDDKKAEEEDDWGSLIPELTPNFTNFLMDEGVDKGLLKQEERDKLQEYFLPEPESGPEVATSEARVAMSNCGGDEEED